MKEFKISISLYVFCVVITLMFGLLGAFKDVHGVLFNILCNLYCRIVIGIITAYCFYFNEKRYFGC